MHEQAPGPTTVETFFQADIRVGWILAAEPLPRARTSAYRLEIDFGPLGRKRSSAQITDLYTLEQVIGRQVLAVVNFPPRRIAGFDSEVLVLGVPDEQERIILLALEREAPLGARVS